MYDYVCILETVLMYLNRSVGNRTHSLHNLAVLFDAKCYCFSIQTFFFKFSMIHNFSICHLKTQCTYDIDNYHLAMQDFEENLCSICN